jgi:hypothetical protein
MNEGDLNVVTLLVCPVPVAFDCQAQLALPESEQAVSCLSIRSARTQFGHVYRHAQISSRGESKYDNAPLCLKAIALDELEALLYFFLPVDISLFTWTSSKPRKRLSDSPAVFGSLEEGVVYLAPGKR